MLLKLFKYEFKAVGRVIGPASAAAVLANLIGAVMGEVFLGNYHYEEKVMEQIARIVLGGMMLVIVAYAFLAAITAFRRFYKHHFTDEGYLTFTLPATVHQHLLASMLNIFVWGVISLFVFLLSLEMDVFHEDPLETVRYILETMFVDPIRCTLEGGLDLFYILSDVGCMLVLPMLSLTLGSLWAKKHKILCAFAIGYGLIMLISIAFTPLRLDILITELESSGSTLCAELLMIGIQLILAVSGYFLMHHMIKRNLNI